MSWRMGNKQKKQSDGYSARNSMPLTDCSRFLQSQWNRHFKEGIGKTPKA